MNRIIRFLSYGLVMIAFLHCGKASAQMVQYGKVVEMNSKGKTLSGVSVTVPSAHDCHPTSSDAYGVFRLSFGEHQTGDVVYGLKAKKYGYEVVNIHVIRDGWTLTDRDTLRIVMAPSAKINEARMRYYDLLETACVSRYDATIRVLDENYANHSISLPEYQYWKVEAENELQRAYQTMDDYAYAFARVNEDDTDAITRELVSKLKGNDMEGAMAIVSGQPYETVLQAYTDFSSTYPLQDPEEMMAKAGMDSIPDPDSLYSDIMVLQTYANLFESDFATSGAKYAKSCAYLGVIYKERGWEEASKKYFNKALRMYEMLNVIEGIEVQDKIDKIKQQLDN